MSRKQGGFWSNLLGLQAPREKFSLEELQHLHEVLRSNYAVTDHNRDIVVEALRAIAELTIWGDQHDPRFFEYFLENNLMRHFSQLLEKPANRRGNVAKQILQTLYILIQNIRSQTAIYYILSNNHVNDIVTLPFDFEDDEVLGYYINLLKTISLRLTSKSVQFFYQDDGKRTAFPLYTEAVTFINHRDGMVRAAVRTLTLNVYGIDDPNIQDFLVSKPASNYFHELAIVLSEQCQLLDRRLSSLEAGTSKAAYAVETKLGDVEDLISYSNDILCTGRPRLSRLFIECLWVLFVRPILLEPLQQLLDPTATAGVLPLCSLCILERLLQLVSHTGFANGIACALLGLQAEAQRLFCDPDLDDRGVPWQASDSCSQCFLQALKGGETVVAAATVRVVLALIQSRSVDADVLDSSGRMPAGLLPRKQKKNKQLLDMLTADGGPEATQDSTTGLFTGQRLSQEGLYAIATKGASQESGRSNSGVTNSVSEADCEVALDSDEEWTDVLCGLLLFELLPCTALWVACYSLKQLLAVPRSSGSVLKPSQQTTVRDALRRAQAAFAAVVSGPWTDALPMLVLREWERAKAQLSSPPFPSSQAAVQAWMQAIQAQKLAIDMGQAQQKGYSARTAADAVHVVQRLVVVLQMHQALVMGQSTAALPIVAASGAHMKRHEAREGLQLRLEEPMACTVSFSRGEEKSVVIAVHGLPEVGAALTNHVGHQRAVWSDSLLVLPDASADTNRIGRKALECVYETGAFPASASPPPLKNARDRETRARREGRLPRAVQGAKISRQGGLDHDEQVALASSCPSMLLAKPSTDPHVGVVLSVAPLVGVKAYTDASHERWLHIHVRPNARGMLKTVKSVPMGETVHQLERQLVEGHWVLSFETPAMARAAQEMISSRAKLLCDLLKDILSPLLS